MLQAGEDILAQAESWNKPLRLWHARGDRLTNFSASEDFAAQAQNCEFTAFEDVEHEMHNDTSREAVYGLMLDFMSETCLLYTSPSPRDATLSRMPSSA